jgi:hypothetical protein
MKAYFMFLVLMLPTISAIGLASATAASGDAKPELPAFTLPHVQWKAATIELPTA